MKNQRGFTLIEVIIGVALLGVISAPFLSALGTSQTATYVTDERETAANLAVAQMEHIKQQDYATSYSPDVIPEEYSGYTASIAVEDVEDRDGLIQMVTVTIFHHGETVTDIEDLKVIR